MMCVMVSVITATENMISATMSSMRKITATLIPMNTLEKADCLIHCQHDIASSIHFHVNTLTPVVTCLFMAATAAG